MKTESAIQGECYKLTVSGCTVGAIQDYIEVGIERCIRVFTLGETCHNQMATLCRYTHVQEISLVAGLVLDIQLRYKWRFVLRKHGDMDMRGSARVGYGAYRTKSVTALRIRDGMSVALEVFIDGLFTALVRMSVASVRITLPYLDSETIEGTAVDIENLAAEVCDQSLCFALLAFDARQVIVVIEWQVDRVKRAGALAWGCD